MFRWQAEAFTSPFEFPRDEVLSIRFPAIEKSPKAVGALGFELSGGDVLYGSLVNLDEKTAELDVARLGPSIRLDPLPNPSGFPGGEDGAPTCSTTRPIWPGRLARGPRPSSPTSISRRAPWADDGHQRSTGTLKRPGAPVKPKPVPPGPGWVEDGRLLRAVKDGATIQPNDGLPLCEYRCSRSWPGSKGRIFS